MSGWIWICAAILLIIWLIVQWVNPQPIMHCWLMAKSGHIHLLMFVWFEPWADPTMAIKRLHRPQIFTLTSYMFCCVSRLWHILKPALHICHLHDQIYQILIMAIYYLEKPQPRAWKNQLGKKTMLSLTLVLWIDWRGVECGSPLCKWNATGLNVILLIPWDYSLSCISSSPCISTLNNISKPHWSHHLPIGHLPSCFPPNKTP